MKRNKPKRKKFKDSWVKHCNGFVFKEPKFGKYTSTFFVYYKENLIGYVSSNRYFKFKSGYIKYVNCSGESPSVFPLMIGLITCKGNIHSLPTSIISIEINLEQTCLAPKRKIIFEKCQTY